MTQAGAEGLVYVPQADFETLNTHLFTLQVADMSQNIQPYSISVPEDALVYLKQRLAFAKLPTQLEPGSNEDHWDFGVPVAAMQRLVEYWKTGFDWRKAESRLNELPQYRTQIEVEGFGSLNIHCMAPISRAPR